MKPKTTIIIVNWNGEKYLHDLTYELKRENCQILIVDNNSDDVKSSWMLTPSECIWLELNDNWGFANANNFAGAIVKTENILLMNNDMLPIRGFLEKMEGKCTDDYPIVGAKLIFGETKSVDVHSGIKLITEKGKLQHAGIGFYDIGLPYEIGRNASPDDPQYNIGKEVIGVTGACLMVKTKVFSELKGFSNSFVNGFEDVDFCLRAREKGYKSWYEPTAEVIHYCSSSKGRFDNEIKNRDLLQSLWSDERLQKLLIK